MSKSFSSSSSRKRLMGPPPPVPVAVRKRQRSRREDVAMSTSLASLREAIQLLTIGGNGPALVQRIRTFYCATLPSYLRLLSERLQQGDQRTFDSLLTTELCTDLFLRLVPECTLELLWVLAQIHNAPQQSQKRQRWVCECVDYLLVPLMGVGSSVNLSTLSRQHAKEIARDIAATPHLPILQMQRQAPGIQHGLIALCPPSHPLLPDIFAREGGLFVYDVSPAWHTQVLAALGSSQWIWETSDSVRMLLWLAAPTDIFVPCIAHLDVSVFFSCQGHPDWHLLAVLALDYLGQENQRQQQAQQQQQQRALQAAIIRSLQREAPSLLIGWEGL